MMAKPVMVQTTMVSMKVWVMDTSACVVAFRVWAAAAAIPPVPSPDSFEKIPRAKPQRTASRTDAPRNPPTAAVEVKASRNTCTAMSSSRVQFRASTVRPPST